MGASPLSLAPPWIFTSAKNATATHLIAAAAAARYVAGGVVSAAAGIAAAVAAIDLSGAQTGAAALVFAFAE